MAKGNNNSNKNNGSFIPHSNGGHVMNKGARPGRVANESTSRRPPHTPPKSGRGKSGNK